MMSGDDWCVSNLRDCQAWRDAGLPLSTTSNEAARLYDASLRQLVAWRDAPALGGIEESLQKMLAADPEAVISRSLWLGLNALSTSKNVAKDPQMSLDLKKLLKDAEHANPREKLHAQAAAAFAEGRMISACILWERILAEHPKDLFALKFAHDAYFFLGDAHRIRDSMARVINTWTPEDPGYSYLHGMLAFGLEECAEYDSAEAHARFALTLNRQDAWATHALAHVFEMNGRFDEGVAFLEGTKPDWSPCQIIACHNFWHNALFYVEQGQHEAAVAIYDEEISRRAQTSSEMLDVVDAASMLLRLELEGVTVGADRWQGLEKVATDHVDDHVLSFNDAHVAMVASRLQDGGSLRQRHRTGVANFVNTGAFDNHRVTSDVGAPLIDAIYDFYDGKYDSAFDSLYALRNDIVYIGGSTAQRDVFTQLAVHAGARSGDPTKKPKIAEIIAARNRVKTNSPLALRLSARFVDNH